jgi:NAD(P)-dependent dehydrogenase (short-subunit alcohol dehydrogenase family)
MKCADKTVVVTGAGSGMGRELVFELLRRKARVAAVDLNAASLQETAKLADVPGDALASFKLNVADHAAVRELPKAVQQKLGAVDGVINCAGIIQPFVRLADLDYTVIDRVFDVNFRGTLFITKAFLPELLKRPAAHIVNVSSMGGFIPFPGQTAYGASKAAVKLMTEGLHAELSESNVRVTVVFPGAIATNIKENSGVANHASSGSQNHEGKAMPADLAARQILDGMEADRYRVLVGKDARFLDAMYRFNPARATSFIAKQMKHILPS